MRKNGQKRRTTAVSGQTGSRNMAETAYLNSQPETSYSFPNTLWDLSRRYLPTVFCVSDQTVLCATLAHLVQFTTSRPT